MEGVPETFPLTPGFLLETQNCEIKRSLQGGLHGGAHLADGGSQVSMTWGRTWVCFCCLTGEHGVTRMPAGSTEALREGDVLFTG